MTTVFVDQDKQTQTIHCSDGTSGVMIVDESNQTPIYNFKFYAHTHPGFFLDANEFHDGESLTLADIMSKDQIKLQFM